MSAVRGDSESAPEAQRLLAPRFSVEKPISPGDRSPVGTASREPGPDLPLVVILLGPTGSGKTALSLELGERFGGEIVSCDSVAVYRGMELGTAKPTIEERARAPHHLIDVTTPDRPFTAGEYSRRARAALSEISGRGRLPIVTGGTGLYLRALTEGLVCRAGAAGGFAGTAAAQRRAA